MVYCNLVSHTDHDAVYSFGGVTNDITGTVKFDFINDTVTIVSPPLREDAPIRHIHRLYRKEKSKFISGVFPEKISYES